jgi:hypothetical protein
MGGPITHNSKSYEEQMEITMRKLKDLGDNDNLISPAGISIGKKY